MHAAADRTPGARHRSVSRVAARAPGWRRHPIVVGLSVVAVVGLVVALVLGRFGGRGSPIRAVDLDTGWSWQAQPAPLDLGITHTQKSLDEPRTAAVERGQTVLAGTAPGLQNQHLMGFGTLNPEPSPGVFDWASLDTRMALIRDTGGRTVLTACCAPDWMKGGAAGQTDWSLLAVAPQPEFFEDFAALTAATVVRYPQIEAVAVWNELKGFWLEEEKRWDYEGYTALYNAVYRAVKAVRPDVRVGGPYTPVIGYPPGTPYASTELAGEWGAADQRVIDVLDYWLVNNVGSDFVVVDAPTVVRTDFGRRPPTDVETGAAKFADITTWLRARTPLPVWWAEFYPDVPAGVVGGPESAASAAATLAALAAFARSGTSVALLWGPQGSDLRYAALWTATADGAVEGGMPTPLTDVWDWLVPRLATGQVEIGRSDAQPLLAFRAADGAVVVNLSGDDVLLPGDAGVFPAWGAVVQPE